MNKKTSIIVLLPALAAFLLAAIPGDAKLLYSQTEYKNLYNEKVSVELELKSLQNQYSNEKSNLQTKIKELENQIDNLNKKIDNLNAQNAKDRDLCDKRTAELQGTIDILKQKSSNREQDLIEENKKMQARYEEELQKARQQLKEERDRHLAEMEELKKNYSDIISKLNATIANLNNELSSLKKLTQAQKEELERMSDQANELEKKLSEEIKLGQIRLKKFHNKLIINLDDRISFDSGSSDLKKEILPALDKITEILAKYPENTIMIEGHTDNIPIKSRKFRDNWQLSTERALSVLNYILQEKKLNKTRFGAAGYGEFHPIVANDTPENRALNRRVDIVLIPRIE
ncbi:MAG TPA: OmpA family protein [Spirochaetota bacterium]|nr:OmpA family protein [Spirochaetota bacterium]HPI88800.1 OmpA family protein [Spirochaetota bacterium]